jgi:signal transduction histidine kinase
VGAQPAGWLYLDVDNSIIRAVDGAMAALALLLAAGLGVMVARTRGKEVELHRTMVELQSSRRQVLDLERLALVGRLSANIFHDIKKPVLNIKHEVADALEGSGLPPEELLPAIHRQTELYLEILRGLGIENFARGGGPEAEWCDVVEAMERGLRLVRYEQGSVVVRRNLPEGEPLLIRGLPHRLVQLFGNLFLNAFQAMEGSGELLVSARKEAGGIVVEVEDSGPGIPPERRGDVFEPFHSTREDSGGSGLGLYICRLVCEDVGGSITCGEPRELQGARFRVEFPAGGEVSGA